MVLGFRVDTRILSVIIYHSALEAVIVTSSKQTLLGLFLPRGLSFRHIQEDVIQ